MEKKELVGPRHNISNLSSAFISLGLILFLHPLVSMMLIAILNIVTRINKTICYLLCISYSILIVNRQYLVRFNEQSGDDTFRYIPFIKEIGRSSLENALTAQVSVFSVEPFSRFYWWLFSYIGFDINFILLFQMLFWSCCLMYFSIKVSKRYPVAIFCIGICFFAYTIPYTFYHLYRQAWGLSFFIIYLSQWDKKSRFIFLSLAALSHLMFIPILILMEVTRRGLRVILSRYLLPIAILSLTILFLTYTLLVAKLGAYSDGDNINYSPAKYVFYIAFFTFLVLAYNRYDTKIIKLSDQRFNIYLVLIVFYIAGLHPAFADIANRYVLLLAPLSLMLLTIRKNGIVLSLMVVASLSKLIIHLNDVDGNIYQYAMKGSMDFYNVIDSFWFFTGRDL